MSDFFDHLIARTFDSSSETPSVQPLSPTPFESWSQEVPPDTVGIPPESEPRPLRHTPRQQASTDAQANHPTLDIKPMAATPDAPAPMSPEVPLHIPESPDQKERQPILMPQQARTDRPRIPVSVPTDHEASPSAPLLETSIREEQPRTASSAPATSLEGAPASPRETPLLLPSAEPNVPLPDAPPEALLPEQRAPDSIVRVQIGRIEVRIPEQKTGSQLKYQAPKPRYRPPMDLQAYRQKQRMKG